MAVDLNKYEEPYFVYKNISSKDMGILVTLLPPITKSDRDVNKIVIPGRDGFLTEDFGTYSSPPKPCECVLLDIANVDQVLQWLDGSGDILFSNQPDRTYKTSIINQIPFNRFMWQWHKFIIIFDCQPFAKLIQNSIITLTTQATVYNAGTHKSKPIIKVYGSGNIGLYINSHLVTLTNVMGYVTINSEIVDCYKDLVLKNGYMSGEFPVLEVGPNIISWTGSVTSIEITPNWVML